MTQHDRALAEVLDYRRQHGAALRRARDRLGWLARRIETEPWSKEFGAELEHKTIADASSSSNGELSGLNAFGEPIPPHLDRWGSEAARSRSDVLKSYEDVLFGYERNLDNLPNAEKAFRLLPHIPWQQARKSITEMGYVQPINATSELRMARDGY